LIAGAEPIVMIGSLTSMPLSVGRFEGTTRIYGITGNGESLKKFRFLVHCAWRRWLSRRHRKRKLDWDKFNRLLLSFPLPPLRVVHSVVGHREANV
jgi:hypothetical protein